MSIQIQDAFAIAGGVVAVLTAIAGIAAGLSTGVLKRIEIAGFTLEAAIRPEDVLALRRSLKAKGIDEEKPFEVVALSNYYNHALLRANVSFWFSLIFAAIGFGVIIFAFATHSQSDVVGTVIKATSGAIIDGVSTLFFIQSTNAQKSMSEFFEKLRLDRLNAEAKSLISEIENAERRDQLRAQLVLKYAAIERLLVSTEPA